MKFMQRKVGRERVSETLKIDCMIIKIEINYLRRIRASDVIRGLLVSLNKLSLGELLAGTQSIHFPQYAIF